MFEHNANNFSENGKEFNYEQFGAKQAENSQGEPEHLKESLSILFNVIEEEAKRDKANIAKRIDSLHTEAGQMETKKNGLQATQKTGEQQIFNLETQIEDIENNKSSVDTISLVIAAFITLLLTFFLWAFYSAIGYCAYNGVKPGTTGFASVFGALSDAFNKGGFVVVITVLFPVIFLGLGFLINDGLNKKKYLLILLPLLFTLCFDLIIGFEITKDIYINGYKKGFTEIPWSNSFAFQDVNFYLILSSGFVCYIMWGLLLNYTLNKHKENQPDVRISKLKQKISTIREDLEKIKAEIINCESNIQVIKKKITGYEHGKVIISPTRFKSLIGEFFGGWAAWTNLMRPAVATELLTKAVTIKDLWVNNIISTLEEL